MPTDDRVTAALEEMWARADALALCHDSGDCPDLENSCTGHDVAARLLPAIRAALEAADRWTSKSEALDAAAEYIAAEHPGEPGAALKHARSIAYDDCARALRQAITSALLPDEALLAAPPEPAAAGLAAEIAADQAGPGGSMNPTPDCGGERKPPGATEVWWCDAHREFNGTSPGEEDGNG